MAHDYPLSHLSFQLADGSTNILDVHDADSFHDGPNLISEKNLAEGAVTNVKIAAGAVTEEKLSQSVRASLSACPFPVGALYLSFVSTNPSTLWPGTTWTQQTGRFIRMANDTSTGGADTVTLTANQIPSHKHTSPIHQCIAEAKGFGLANPNQGFDGRAVIYQSAGSDYMPTTNTGGGQAHNNMPAYQDVYAWRRTA